MLSKSLVYLAVPYTHPDPAVMEYRFKAVNLVAGILMKQGIHIFSPISHTHPIAVECDLPRGFDFWEQYDRAILQVCRKVIVLKLPGWEQSKGVQAEIKIAEELGIPVEYLETVD